MKLHKNSLIALLLFAGIIASNLDAQVIIIGPGDEAPKPPPALTYQGEARDDKGDIIKNTTLEIFFIIKKSETTNISEWKKEYQVTTDKYGMFTVVLGDPEGNDVDFNDIPWSTSSMWLQVILTYKGEDIDMGSYQFLSVPYAMHAETADFVLNDNNEDDDADPTNELQDWNTLPGIPEDIADGDDVEDADADPTNELQDWSTLPGIPEDIANGDDVEDADADPANEIQTISKTGSVVTLSNGGGSIDLGAPFPRPAYDSEWIPLGAYIGTYSISLTHNIGGNVDDYFVDLQIKSYTYGITNKGIGQDEYYISDYTSDKYRYEGAFYGYLTNESIIVRAGTEDYGLEYVRVRIWVYN